MKIFTNGKKVETIKVKDMPEGSIGMIDGKDYVYIIRTIENGNKFIRIWPHSNGIEAVQRGNEAEVDNWNVVLLPKGTTLTLEF